MKLRDILRTSNPRDLEVVVDNQAAFENVTRFLRGRNYAVEHTKEGGLWRIGAHADAAAPAAGSGAAEDVSPYARVPGAEDMRTLVMVMSSFLGVGDDALGRKLMKNFLATLPEMGSALWRVVLLNGGVALAAQNSPVLEELQALERSGVDVLVCGACLEHFGLARQKAVGTTTNMLDVVTSMQAAHKVIRA